MWEFKEAVRKHIDGATIDLFVIPGTKSVVFPAGYNKWRKRLETKVCSEARDNKANKEVVKTVADFFNKSTVDVSIVSGRRSREKTLLVRDVSTDDVIKRLKEYL